MKLTVRSRAFPHAEKASGTHFLLSRATLGCALSFEGGTTMAIAATRTAPSTFVIDIAPAVIPARLDRAGRPVLEDGVPSRQLLTRLELDYRCEVTLGGLTFPALRIVQRLQPSPRGTDGRMRVDYLLAAGSWLDALGRRRVANAAVHPLVDLGKLPAGEVLLDTLMLDITPGWRRLHQNNPTYQAYDVVSRNRGLTFKVFAHTAGTPLIWYAVIPSHLRGGRPVSPHVFLQPSDNREGQSPRDEERYLLRNDRYFATDGSALMAYLLPPIPDVRVPSLGPQVSSPERQRNVVNFRKATIKGKETGEITTDHWNIGAGLQRAFEHAGSGKPAQLLLVPQRVGEKDSSASESYGGAVTKHLVSITDALFGLIESNTDLTASGGDVMLARDKLVISAYSESGYDLWHVSQIHRDGLKAIVGIEPQNLNTVQNDYRRKGKAGAPTGPPPLLGRNVIPDLLKRHVQVFIIGRHHLHYGPQIADRSKLRLLPAHPAQVFRYPPDPSVNDFIKYRVHRMIVPADDPMLLPEETAILAQLAARGITGLAVLPKIFGPKGNEDRSLPPSLDDGVARWYSHHFALTGGDEMHLDPSGVYGKPVSYRTWFEVAVHEIG